MTEIKQTAESPQTVPVVRPEETASLAEPAHVERVTKKKDPKKVAAGRAGAAARQKRLLEQLQAAKESLGPPATRHVCFSKGSEAHRRTARTLLDPMDHRGLSGGGFTCVCLCGRKHALARQSCLDGGRPRGQSPGYPIEGLPRPPLYGIRP